MLYRFLLVSQDNKDAVRIKEELERNKLYEVTLVDKAEDALDHIRQSQVDCVVFNLQSFTTEKTTFASHLRDCGYQFPIMMFANHVQISALEILKKIPKAVFIEKPFESKDVWGIADKLVQGHQVAQRIHRRFYTNQKAVMVNATSGEQVTAQIFNMSHGGAYIEVDNGQLNNGDILRLKVPLDKFSKNYVVDIKVVWASRQGFWQGKPAAGVVFLKASDVYRNLIEKL